MVGVTVARPTYAVGSQRGPLGVTVLGRTVTTVAGTTSCPSPSRTAMVACVALAVTAGWRTNTSPSWASGLAPVGEPVWVHG